MTDFDIAIIGAGSGNTILDERYDDKRIAICEQGLFGGTCLNVGCIPTKMFVYTAGVARTVADAARYGIDARVDAVRWPDIVSRVFGRIDPIAVSGENYRRCSPNVEVFSSHTRFLPSDGPYRLRTEDGDEFTAEKVVIAAGSRAVVPEQIADCGVPYHTSDTIMRIPELPEELIIIGGGFVACEFAHVFSALGSRVTMLIRGSTLLRGHDDDIATRFTDLAARKWDVRSNHELADARRVGDGIEINCRDGSVVRGDMLLVATGRRANGDLLDAHHAGVELTADGRVVVDRYQRTTARGIFALGDVCSDYRLKHVANHEARVVKHNLLQDWDDTEALMPADHRYVPSAVFTDPEIAGVGLTENQARAKGYRIKVKIQDYADVAYGWAMEDTTSIAKVIVDADTGLILGAHIMGPQAATLIQPVVQAMSFGLPAQQMARGQYWIHPALPEVIENALLALCGEPPWPPPKRH
ncbi:mycothione reductase [Mycolicibacterium hassiacum DSM 44199]|uniref:Mycothione reductase n=1 Tax=Mycolicibacterium hassiacum (strain DSM 44199 / CIP 105218 / JCM 12690 / 3849) TaxID=1122247 RepID=K5BK40_MYCHD|nr:mycothione reductase [Mycolicibacterium hassiacum]EKF24199.1 mycothione reductase [Mycolicibacterium hassiacum DSM 44199]MBX5486030.1 mycothione reductase [Mycolicibacterium hassiacum]MDA4087687.1 mycothione reductase [Mycolicibacterium hassiacum DSM 44199]PZN24656.1 MAG: mycothione reductase [Mycolicibacterium hassiacum]VCT90730.1 Mycothione reductase [Mycolicibacterium hassiacum DSM 44199]